MIDRLIIFDADGTLRRCTVPGQPCPNNPGEWELLPGVRNRLAQIDWRTTGFAIASNQGGVGLGLLDVQVAVDMLAATGLAALDGTDGVVNVFCCTHAPNAGCDCRKPAPGLLLRAMRVFGVTPVQTLMVGDMDSDRVAAHRAGCSYQDAWAFFGWPRPSDVVANAAATR